MPGYSPWTALNPILEGTCQIRMDSEAGINQDGFPTSLSEAADDSRLRHKRDLVGSDLQLLRYSM